MRYPIFSRGVIMRTGRGRVQADAQQVPVSLGDVRVEPGDFVVGDGDGVVVIPAARAEEVLEVAAGQVFIEEGERAEHLRHPSPQVRSGHSLRRHIPGVPVVLMPGVKDVAQVRQNVRPNQGPPVQHLGDPVTGLFQPAAREVVRRPLLLQFVQPQGHPARDRGCWCRR